MLDMLSDHKLNQARQRLDGILRQAAWPTRFFALDGHHSVLQSEGMTVYI
jgi:hypothetical protein